MDDQIQEAPSLDNLIKNMKDMSDEELQANIRGIRDERRKTASGPPPKARTTKTKEDSGVAKQNRPAKKTIIDLMSDEEKAAMLNDIKNLEI